MPDDMEREPMLLLDVTGSMNYSTSPDDDTPRKQTVREALGTIVATLGAQDTAGKEEESGGGMRTITFSGGDAHDLGDINSKNLRDIWPKIKFRGGTFIVPGWQKLIEAYEEEFGGKSEKPVLIALIITDGDAEDREEFEKILEKQKGDIFVCICVIGHGEEHDAAMKQYTTLSTVNRHVKLMAFGSETDPKKIAKACLKMIE